MTHLINAIEIDRLRGQDRTAAEKIADRTFQAGLRCWACEYRRSRQDRAGMRLRSCAAPSANHCPEVTHA